MDEKIKIETRECSCNNNQEDVMRVVEEVVAETGKGKEKVIPILQAVQDKLNYIPSEALKHICAITDISPGQISGVSTFYNQFRHIPYGEHTIKVCVGTACHVKGADLVIDAVRRDLEIGPDTNTTDDGRFSLEKVACLGCCTLAPVVQIDNKTYGHVKTTEIKDIVDDFLNRKDHGEVSSPVKGTPAIDTEIRVGLGSCCIAGGSRDVLTEVEKCLSNHKLNVKIKPVGCVGVCNQTPLLEFAEKDGKSYRYTNVRTDQVEDIVLKHIKPAGKIKKFIQLVNDWADTFHTEDKVRSPVNLPDSLRERYLDNFLKKQIHIATENYGLMSPFSFEEYRKSGGYTAIEKVITDNKPADIIETLRKSGLRGRGGGGYLTTLKWELTRKAAGSKKYIIINGDEGDPGAFMDRMLIESFPYRVLEGMMIGAFVVGANEGIFYIRAEYPLAVERMGNAIKRCRENGIIGRNIFGSNFSFEVSIFEGAGAFVCGEETALISSIEGDRGNPKYRPPYPAEKGLYGKPTLVNNAETLCMVPWIINNGPEKFRSIGTTGSSGTKVFALAGKVARGGLIEVPMGISIKEIVEDIGDGVAGERTFKAVQIGGPSGGCIPAELAHTPVDFDELTKLGAMMGSGGLVVLDDSDCMVDIAKYFLTFTHNQSCGKCTFCRVGTGKMLEILTRFTEGRANIDELDELERLGNAVINGSLCGLGKTAPNPVLTTIKYFREEYIAHTKGICPAGKCKDLIRYHITDDCIGCTKCAQECPVNAIAYTPYEKHVVDDEICIKCDNCLQICPVAAVLKKEK
jgi:NADH-quinone oxidoreductase subunit F